MRGENKLILGKALAVWGVLILAEIEAIPAERVDCHDCPADQPIR